MNKELNINDALELIYKLPFIEFRNVVQTYSKTHGGDFNKELDRLSLLSLEQELEKLKINEYCPKCNSFNIRKYTKRPNGIQEYQCKDCKNRFTRFKGTILEKSKFHIDVWVKVLEMTLNNYSIKKMQKVLEDDFKYPGINEKTLWLWKMKLIHAIAQMPMPTLEGVIQIDECFVRESQKGTRNLINYSDKKPRIARKGANTSSMGVMGNEWATITTAIDDKGHCVCYATNLGRLTVDTFTTLFDKHINKAYYICTDANPIYSQYSRARDVRHYERPAKYLDILKNNSYQLEVDKSNPYYEDIMKNNQKIAAKLYEKGEIDKITTQYMPYKEFVTIKKQYGLNLSRVNQLHDEIKRFINRGMKNVSTKYLQDYIGFFTYIRNWKADHDNKYPTSNVAAREILIEILKQKTNLTITEIENKKLELPKADNQYLEILKEQTEKIRKETSNKYFKFGPEDGVATFKKREYLLDQKKSKLIEIAKQQGIKKIGKLSINKASDWIIVNKLMELSNIEDIIFKLLAEDKQYRIDEEDLKKLKSKKYTL